MCSSGSVRLPGAYLVDSERIQNFSQGSCTEVVGNRPEFVFFEKILQLGSWPDDQPQSCLNAVEEVDRQGPTVVEIGWRNNVDAHIVFVEASDALLVWDGLREADAIG